MTRLGFGVLVFQLKDAFGVARVAFLIQIRGGNTVISSGFF